MIQTVKLSVSFKLNALHAAVDMEVGQSKMPNSEVAGQASVLIWI
jgi:hypothetical protein